MSNNKIIRILQTILVSLVGIVSPSFAQTLFLVKKLDEKVEAEQKAFIGVDLAVPGSERTLLTIPISEWNKLVTQKIALQNRLKAAADALRQIECLTNDVYATENVLTGVIELTFLVRKSHEMAQDGYRATK